MSETYTHACERAELLGLPIPSEEEWKEAQRIEDENRVNDEDDEAIIQVNTLVVFFRKKTIYTVTDIFKSIKISSFN